MSTRYLGIGQEQIAAAGATDHGLAPGQWHDFASIGTTDYSYLKGRVCRILSARTAEPEYIAITEASAAERGSRFETQASTPYRRRADGHPSFIGEYIDQFGQLCPFRRCDPHVLERTRRITHR